MNETQPSGEHAEQNSTPIGGARPEGGVVPHPDPHCDGDVCITCSDEAVRVTVVELRPGGIARVDTGVGEEEVSVALVDAAVGDVVLVHAKEAIVDLGPASADPEPGTSGDDAARARSS